LAGKNKNKAQDTISFLLTFLYVLSRRTKSNLMLFFLIIDVLSFYGKVVKYKNELCYSKSLQQGRVELAKDFQTAEIHRE
jgi:hypothetical protein